MIASRMYIEADVMSGEPAVIPALDTFDENTPVERLARFGDTLARDAGAATVTEGNPSELAIFDLLWANFPHVLRTHAYMPYAKRNMQGGEPVAGPVDVTDPIALWYNLFRRLLPWAPQVSDPDTFMRVLVATIDPLFGKWEYKKGRVTFTAGQPPADLTSDGAGPSDTMSDAQTLEMFRVLARTYPRALAATMYATWAATVLAKEKTARGYEFGEDEGYYAPTMTDNAPTEFLYSHPDGAGVLDFVREVSSNVMALYREWVFPRTTEFRVVVGVDITGLQEARFGSNKVRAAKLTARFERASGVVDASFPLVPVP